MKVRKGSIVVRRSDGSENPTSFRVEKVEGSVAILRDLTNYMRTDEHVEGLSVRYQTEIFETGDIVRIRDEYVDRYSESEGGNDLTVVTQYNTNNALTTRVEDNLGDEFTILNERLFLVRPGKGFKKGDKVEIDHDRAKKFGDDDDIDFWANAGVMTLTEDSGSRTVKYTSNVVYKGGTTNNVPTRWLKPYVEPAKRVVGETVKAEDIKVGDKVMASYIFAGCQYEITGDVIDTYNLGPGFTVAMGSAVFLSEGKNITFVLLEEAPEPVDENLQRLLDAEVGEIAHSTYAHEYWRKVGDDEWMLLELDAGFTRTTKDVFDRLFKMKYGELHIYRKVSHAD